MDRQAFPAFAATLVIDETLTILSADDAGRAALDRGEGLRRSLGRLCTGSLTLNARIRDSIAHGKAEGDIPIPAGGSLVSLSILPVSPFGAGAGRQAVLMLRGTSAPADAVAEAGRACGLTTGETEVLRLIYKGLNTVEAASVMGVAKSTVRTHLQHIFAKTDTSRQSELVHFVAGFQAVAA